MNLEKASGLPCQSPKRSCCINCFKFVANFDLGVAVPGSEGVYSVIFTSVISLLKSILLGLNVANGFKLSERIFLPDILSLSTIYLNASLGLLIIYGNADLFFFPNSLITYWSIVLLDG